MEQTVAMDAASATAKAQRLRLKRILGGAASYALTAAIVTVCWGFGYLGGDRLVHFVIAVAAINLLAVGLVLSNWNLRFADPSMTAGLIIASLAPSVYAMYHVSEPMIRAPFLLMATVAMLFGVLALNFRRMLMLGGVVMASYLLMLAALYRWAPERLDLRIETVMVVAYAIVLVQIASLGSYIGGLRDTLRQKNAALTDTMAELEVLATRDPLTRLPNRRTAMLQLDRELSRTERRDHSGDGLCVALLDVDHFKLVNDKHGHQAGDEVLRALSETMSATMRQGDFVARFGGEEFLVILPETTLEGGTATAERLRQAVLDASHHALPGDDPITVSIGLAIHIHGRRIEETLGLADQALYDAKHRGRNQVSVWCDATGQPEPAGARLAGQAQAPV